MFEFLFLEGVDPKQINSEWLLKVCKDSSSSLATVYNWVSELKRVRANLEDDLHQAPPKGASTSEIITEIHDIWFLNIVDWLRGDLVEALDIPLGSESYILIEILGLKKTECRMGIAVINNGTNALEN